MNNKVLTFLYFLLISSICLASANNEGVNKNYFQKKSYHPDLVDQSFRNYLPNIYFINEDPIDPLNNILLNDDFEVLGNEWLFSNSDTNIWVIGNAVNNGGVNSLYISNDAGVTNAYSNTSVKVSHAYRELSFPQNVGDVSLQFDWRCNGEGATTKYDYFRVWLVPTTFTPTAGTQITTTNSGGIQLGLGGYNLNTVFLNENIVFDAAAYANTSMRLVFEWRNDGSGGAQPPAAIDNLNISLIACSAPSNLSFNSVAHDSFNVAWIAPTVGGGSYDLYLSTSNVEPNEVTTPTATSAVVNYSFNNLIPSTSYFVWVRTNCGVEDGVSFWIGPLAVSTFQIPVALPYEENFEAVHGWSFIQDSNNKWFVGDAVNNGGTNALYISNDQGENNAYTTTSTQVTQAYRDIVFPQEVGEVSLQFDWRSNGEGTTTKYDYFRVWLVPSTFVPTAGTQITTANSGGVQLGLSAYNLNTVFLNENIVFDAAAYANTSMRLVFEWRNDGSGGAQPPAAIDNLNLSLVTCSAPSNLILNDLGQNSMDVSWTAPGMGGGNYDLYLSTSNVAPNVDTNPTATSTTINHIFDELNPSTTYYIWVRTNCGVEDGASFWTGPLEVTTNQVPVTIPYHEDFEAVHGWSFVQDSTNKWFVGNAVNNGGTNALYISNDQGENNAYTTSATQVTQAYRDITFPQQVGEASLKFDWRCNGEGTTTKFDYFRVWLVPITFVPTAGTQITVANSAGIQLGLAAYNLNTAFLNENIVFDAAAYANTSMRLVFEWRNDGSGGAQPPAAIDNLNLSLVTCSAPSNLILNNLDQNTINVSWTAPGLGGGNYDLYLSTDPAAPVDTTVPTANTTELTYTFENLNPSIKYYIWVRTNCGTEDGKSFWTGPLAVTTAQIPATLPYEEDFEGANNWSFTEGPIVNQWVVGTAVNNGGTHSLYVSKDGGTTHTYETSGTTVVHAYRDFFVEGVSGELEVGFDRLCNGEGFSSTKYDYLNVWIVPSSYSPIGGTLIENTTNSGGFKIVDKYNGNAEAFLTEEFSVSLNSLNSSFSSGNFRIVFEWRQDSGGGNQPPAAIDNLRIKKVTCPAVIDLQSEILNAGTSVKLSWTPTGTETQWEVFILDIDDVTIPNENSVGIIVNTPQYIYTEGVADQFYKFYVRPICSEEDKGRWSDTGVISFIPPPGCAVVEADIEFSDLEGLEPNEKGDYIICQDEPVNLKFGSSYYDIPGTNEYDVEAIEYRPPFPFTGGGVIELEEDDYFSKAIDLGFDFCYFGNSYNKVSVNTNGAITFSIAGVVEGGRYTPDASSSWSFNSPIPVDPGGTSAPFVNSIFGVFQDSDPTDSPEGYSINYQIIGKAPCRTLVFNMYHLGMFSCGYNADDIEGSTQTSQIVLYEGTNIIEVYVKNRLGGCAWNSGSGLIGIQNADGTIAYTPPGRNTGNWTATEEAWRFSPSGESSVSFEWEKDGEFFSSESEIEVSITESVRYTARATYQICGEDFSLYKEFNFLKEDFAINGIEDFIDCSRKPGELNIFDLRSNDSLVLGDLDPEKYTIGYYREELDAEKEENALPDVFEIEKGGMAYVRLTNLTTGCFKIRAFRLIVSDPVSVTKVPDAWVCESFEFPALKPGEAYYTKPYGEGERYEAGDIYSQLGKRRFYVYRINEYDCYGQSSFDLEIVEAPVADILKDQLLKCETYFLPTPSVNNKYFTEPGGQGIELPAKLEIRKPMTIYVYAKIVGTTGMACVDESSFKVDFEDCPLPKGISPNGDGLNDSFDLTGYGILDIKIYNRYGTEVFSYGETYTNEWHGQDKAGQSLPDGTYYYVAIANGKVRTGWVQINR